MRLKFAHTLTGLALLAAVCAPRAAAQNPDDMLPEQSTALAKKITGQLIEALGGAGKAYLLSDFASHGASMRAISDPIGMELDVYRATADELEDEIRRALDRITAERGSGAA